MRILIVDDDLVDREHIKRTLNKTDVACEFVEAESVEEGLSAFRAQYFDVILLDYRMPKRDGIELLLEMRSGTFERSFAVIMLSNSEETKVSLECLRAGAQDFLLKSEVSVVRLYRAILQAQTRFELEQKLYNSYKKAKKLAEHDSLTGLSNRYSFEETLHFNTADTCREKTKLALVLFDLDHFKYVNDNHGHFIGDLLLKEVAARVNECLRKNEMFARLGGDEFGIIINHVDCLTHVTNIVSRILRTIKDPFLINDIDINIGASIGISVYPDNSTDPKSLIKYADIAMYRSKKLGRNQICYFEGEMQKEFLHRYEVERELKNSLKNNEFKLHYQPIINPLSQAVCGFEALIRRETNDAHQMPDEFIGIAEDSGMILKIGSWVIEEAIMQLSQWENAFPTPITMSVNLSAVQFKDQNLLEHIKSCIKKYRVNPDHLSFELTETTLLKSNDYAVELINSLHDIGCHITLDDFGAGFSSVSNLQEFPISTVKIDKSLMLFSTQEKALALIKGLTLMLHSLELEIIAEGIEEERSLALCKALNIHRVQGFYFSEALKPSEVEKKYLS